MTESENEDDKLVENPVGDLKTQAEQVDSKESFLKILAGISEICVEDKESWERRMVHFVDVVEDFMRHDFIDTPKDQDWKWLAKLFLIGAFEN